MISIDGNFLEGGGSIVRVALALSTLTGKPFKVDNIRKGREQPGLKNQHLYCIKALEELCDAKTLGAELASSSLEFTPGKVKPKTLSIDIGTAGSITLLTQAILLPSIFSGSKINISITGGTDVTWSPQFDYFRHVFLPQLAKYADIKVKLENRGYYPKGGGKVDLKIRPKYNADNLQEAPQLNLIGQGNLIQVKGISHASIDLQHANVAERQARSARLALSGLNCPVNIQAQYRDTLSTGSGITLWAIFSKDPGEIDFINPIRIGSDSLGKRGKSSEDVGKDASDNLLKEVHSDASVDKHLADQLIPYLALIGGSIKVSEITDHTMTNIYVCEKFLEKKPEIDKEKNIISYN